MFASSHIGWKRAVVGALRAMVVSSALLVTTPTNRWFGMRALMILDV
jgi:hypothetical protein